MSQQGLVEDDSLSGISVAEGRRTWANALTCMQWACQLPQVCKILFDQPDIDLLIPLQQHIAESGANQAQLASTPRPHNSTVHRTFHLGADTAVHCT